MDREEHRSSPIDAITFLSRLIDQRTAHEQRGTTAPENETLRILRDKFLGTSEQLQEDEPSIRTLTKHVQPTGPLDVVKTDPSDNRILECAVAAGSKTVVTGDVGGKKRRPRSGAAGPQRV